MSTAAVLSGPELLADGEELRLHEDAEGWDGYIREDGQYYWIDTRRPENDWTRRAPVPERTVRLAVQRHFGSGGEA